MAICYRMEEYTYGGLKTKGIVYGVNGQGNWFKNICGYHSMVWTFSKSNMWVLSFSSSQREEGEFEESPVKTKFIIVAREFY